MSENSADQEERAPRDADAAQAATAGPEKRLGSVVDKYTLVRVLGRGGMGAVYEARHATLARRFAVKFLLPELANNREVLRRFENEAKAAGGLEHPNIAAVTDFGRATDGAPYLVMEFLDGEDCAALLRRLGPLPVPRAANIVAQACRGLAVAHKATIVHRDLKPENLFVCDAGDGSDHIKVLDFGIAKLRLSEVSVVTGTGATFGTAYYMSPEQARGAGEVDERADVWSLGVVLYELLSGRRPFEGAQFLNVIHQILSVEPPPVNELRSGLPPALAAVVNQAMKKDAAQRFPSVVALAEALGPFAGRPFIAAASTPIRSREAMLPTMPTPATGISLGTGAKAASRASLAAGSPFAASPASASSSPAPSFASSPASWSPSPVPSRGRWLMVGVLLALVAGGSGLLILLRKGTQAGAPVLAGEAATAGLIPSPPRAAPAQGVAPTPSVPAAPLEAPRREAAPISKVATDEAQHPAPAGPSRDVRSVSDRRSIGRKNRPATGTKTVSPVPAEGPAPATSAPSPSGVDPIEIQRDNPYDP